MKNPKEAIKIILVLGGAGALFALAYFIRENYQILPETVVQQLPGIVCMSAILMFSIFPVGFVGWLLLKVSSSDEAETMFYRLKNHLCAKIATKNTAAIYPCLQDFLYFVLTQKNGFLKLPLGKDMTCLSPYGHLHTFRRKCTFYRYVLTCPQQPELDCDTLRQIIQNYIVEELNNHGATYLVATYAYGDTVLPGVFLDRVYYDNTHHCLVFDVLYVCTFAAAEYVAAAYKRDNLPAQTEQEFFDDDLQ